MGNSDFKIKEKEQLSDMSLVKVYSFECTSWSGNCIQIESSKRKIDQIGERECWTQKFKVYMYITSGQCVNRNINVEDIYKLLLVLSVTTISI